MSFSQWNSIRYYSCKHTEMLDCVQLIRSWKIPLHLVFTSILLLLIGWTHLPLAPGNFTHCPHVSLLVKHTAAVYVYIHKTTYMYFQLLLPHTSQTPTTSPPMEPAPPPLQDQSYVWFHRVCRHTAVHCWKSRATAWIGWTEILLVKIQM